MIRLKLKELLATKNIKQKELAALTGIRESSISEMARDSKTTINKEHLNKVMLALKVEDISDIIAYKKED